MTPEESQQLVYAGSVFFWNNCSSLLLCGLTGAYLLAFAISMHILLQRRNTGKAPKAMIMILLMGCSLIMLYTYASSIDRLVLVKFGLVVSLPGGLAAQVMAANSQQAATVSFVLQDIAAVLMVLICDATIVWRAWVVCGESRITKFVLMIMMLTDIGVGIADLSADIKQALNLAVEDVVLDWIASVMNLAVNVTATLPIVYRAWTHHRSIRAISRSSRKTQVEAILLLFIESGALFAAIQVLYTVTGVLSVNSAPFTPVNKLTFFVAVLYNIGAVLYPVAMVILVNTKNTYEHSFHMED